MIKNELKDMKETQEQQSEMLKEQKHMIQQLLDVLGGHNRGQLTTESDAREIDVHDKFYNQPRE